MKHGHLRRRDLLLAGLALAGAGAARAADGFSDAEQALFISEQLANVQPPATLRYRFVKSGSLEDGFEDAVALRLRARADRRCCLAQADFLSGPRRLALPEAEVTQGNPVLLYFLERDIREMSRLTGGQPAYFRKRIRMAVYGGAQIRTLELPYRGRGVAARQIVIAPYVDDPMRERFERLAGKRYVFTLSDAVPGGVYAISTRVDAAAGAPPLLAEELLLDGATPPPTSP